MKPIAPDRMEQMLRKERTTIYLFRRTGGMGEKLQVRAGQQDGRWIFWHDGTEILTVDPVCMECLEGERIHFAMSVFRFHCEGQEIGLQIVG